MVNPFPTLYRVASIGRVRVRPGDVAQAYVGQDLRKLHVFVSDPARTHLMAAEAPSAQIGRRQDLEMVTPEVLAKSASQNVAALKNKMGHQVDADGELRRGTWQVDGGQLFSGCNGAAASAHG